MTFNSYAFFAFFIAIALAYGIIREKYRWQLLLLASIAFYLFSGFSGAFYVLFTIVTTYFAALYLHEHKSKLVVGATSFANFGILFVIKYFNFFAGSLLGNAYTGFNFILPLGISFYTFQMMGYLIDVYRGTIAPQKNFTKLLLFGTFFPQMITGPINRYAAMEKKLYAPSGIEYRRCRDALLLFAWGLFKKICVADNLKIYVDMIYGNYQTYHGILVLSGAITYAIFIYADFSGCVDMACGIAKYFGIELVENFNFPYFSTSIDEFWRRWHISLNNWFKDYLFYPILRSKPAKKFGKTLKSKKKLARTLPVAFALAVVWFVTGLWHGANYTYILWGAYHGIIMIFIMVRREYGKKKTPAPRSAAWIKCLQILATFLIVCLGYIVFNAESVPAAFAMFKSMFTVRGLFGLDRLFTCGVTFFKQVGGEIYFTITVLSVIVLILHDALKANGKDVNEWLKNRNIIFKYVLACVVVFILLFMMNRTSGNFTYMRF